MLEGITVQSALMTAIAAGVLLATDLLGRGRWQVEHFQVALANNIECVLPGQRTRLLCNPKAVQGISNKEEA